MGNPGRRNSDPRYLGRALNKEACGHTISEQAHNVRDPGSESTDHPLARLEAHVTGHQALQTLTTPLVFQGVQTQSTQLETDPPAREGVIHDFMFIKGTLLSTAVKTELSLPTTWVKISKPSCSVKAARP